MTDKFDHEAAAQALGLHEQERFPNPLEPVQRFGAVLVRQFHAEPIDLVEFGQTYGHVSPYRTRELSNLQGLAADIHAAASEAPYLPGTEFYHSEPAEEPWGQEEEEVLADPADFIVDALLSFKPGAVSAEEVVYGAYLRAGHSPPFPNYLNSLAQDLIDNDERLHRGEQ